MDGHGAALSRRATLLLAAPPLAFLALFFAYPVASILGLGLAPAGQLDLGGLLATWTQPYVWNTVIFTLALAMAGHLTSEVRAIWQGEATWIPKVIWYLVPNLQALSLNASVIYRSPVPAGAWLAALYGAFYAAAALSLASLTFERRDLR